MFPLGAAQLQALKTFVPSLATYGVAGGSLVVYIASEWKGKDLLQFVPIYNRSVRVETGTWALHCRGRGVFREIATTQCQWSVLAYPKTSWLVFSCLTAVLYGTRAPLLGPFRALKTPILIP